MITNSSNSRAGSVILVWFVLLSTDSWRVLNDTDHLCSKRYFVWNFNFQYLKWGLLLVGMWLIMVWTSNILSFTFIWVMRSFKRYGYWFIMVTNSVGLRRWMNLLRLFCIIPTSVHIHTRYGSSSSMNLVPMVLGKIYWWLDPSRASKSSGILEKLAYFQRCGWNGMPLQSWYPRNKKSSRAEGS